MSGAFGLLRRDVVVEVGGYARDCIGEDAELVVRLHHRLCEAGRDYRVEFVAEPVCWTEVPRSLRVLGAQRHRWARGLAETLLRHRVTIGNPRYGRIGLLVVPYQLVLEVLGPIIELAGLLNVVVGLPLGLVDVEFAWRFALVAIGYGVVLSLAAVAVEEFSFRHYRPCHYRPWVTCCGSSSPRCSRTSATARRTPGGDCAGWCRRCAAGRTPGATRSAAASRLTSAPPDGAPLGRG